MKSFNKFIEEMASSAFASSEEQPQQTALQKAKEKFAAKKAAAADKAVSYTHLRAHETG